MTNNGIGLKNLLLLPSEHHGSPPYTMFMLEPDARHPHGQGGIVTAPGEMLVLRDARNDLETLPFVSYGSGQAAVDLMFCTPLQFLSALGGCAGAGLAALGCCLGTPNGYACAVCGNAAAVTCGSLLLLCL